MAESFLERIVVPVANPDDAESTIDGARDSNASAIVFTPRGGSRWRNLLTGDVAHRLVENSDVPVLVLPDREVSEA